MTEGEYWQLQKELDLDIQISGLGARQKIDVKIYRTSVRAIVNRRCNAWVLLDFHILLFPSHLRHWTEKY